MTAPKDQSALRYGAPKRAVRQPTPGEHLWTVRTAKGALIRCELRDDGDAGAERQLFHNAQFVDGSRWQNREAALVDTDRLKANHLAHGATLVD